MSNERYKTLDEAIKDADRTVLVDLDHCLVDTGFPGTPGAPRRTAVRELEIMRRQGLKPVIFTARVWDGWDGLSKLSAEDNRRMIEDWMRRYGLPFEEVTNEKRPALAYLDDKAIQVARDSDWHGISAIVKRMASSGK